MLIFLCVFLRKHLVNYNSSVLFIIELGFRTTDVLGRDSVLFVS
jgi:hypothetical protein